MKNDWISPYPNKRAGGSRPERYLAKGIPCTLPFSPAINTVVSDDVSRPANVVLHNRCVKCYW